MPTVSKPPEDGFMTREEFAFIYPALADRYVVILWEHSGDRVWRKREDGWYRDGADEH